MKILTQPEFQQVAGGLTGNQIPTQVLAMGTLVGLAIIGAQRLTIDALKGYCKSIVNVDSFSIFLGDKFGTQEHFSHIMTSAIAIGAVTGLLNEII